MPDIKINNMCPGFIQKIFKNYKIKEKKFITVLDHTSGPPLGFTRMSWIPNIIVFVQEIS